MGQNGIQPRYETHQTQKTVFNYIPNIEYKVESMTRCGGFLTSFEAFGNVVKRYLVFDIIYQTRETVFHQNIQTPRRELKIRLSVEYF